MNIDVLSFTPRNELEPMVKVQQFVELCKKATVLGARAQFDLNIWNVGHFKGQNKINRVVFSTLEASKVAKPEPILPAPFLDFAKAMIVYMHDKRPVVSQAPRISALRCLDAALRQLNKASRPTCVDLDVLDKAVELAKNQFSAGVAYRVAGQIEYIAALMHAKGFITLRQPWMHGQRKPSERGSRISPDAIKARLELLPSAALLRALAGIFRDAVKAADVLVASNTALMICAPERINEVVRLRRNCLVEGDGEFRGKLGLRWSGSKGFQNTTKWLPTAMVPVARDAVANLLEVTSPANELARWYAANPQVVFLHEQAKHLRNKLILSPSDVALILWGDETAVGSALNWIQQTHKLHRVRGDDGREGYLFSDLERAVVSLLPSTFPFMPGAPDLRCEDAMAVMRLNEMHSNRATYLCMFTSVGYGEISNHYRSSEARCVSIFERFGYTEDDGSPIELRSHALRHYLNMLAQMGGLSSAEIALFSGRRDQKQNRAYDHMTSDEVQAPIAAALRNGFTSELELATPRKELVNRHEFRGIGVPAAHTTEFGWCQHDFASEPCQMYADCINCGEQECVKGDIHKEANLRKLRDETMGLLEKARIALNEKEYGADAWVAHQAKTLERIDALLAILEDPNLPTGSRVRLDLTNAPLITQAEVHFVKFFRKSRKVAIT